MRQLDQSNVVKKEDIVLHSILVHTMFTEPTSIPWTFFHLALGINVLIQTLIPVTAFTILGIKPAFRHLFHIEYMQKFTVFALLTQSTQPVLADYGLFSVSAACVFILTCCSFMACSTQKVFTNVLI